MIPKLAAFDLDETLLLPDGSLSAANRTALEALVSVGCTIVSASGRPYSVMPEAVLQSAVFQYAICGNGSAVYDLSAAAPLYSLTLSSDSVEFILGLADRFPAALEVYLDSTAYCQASLLDPPDFLGLDSREIRYFRSTRIPLVPFAPQVRSQIARVNGFSFVTSDPAVRAELLAALRNRPGLYLTSSSNTLLEIAPINSGKHQALAFLCCQLSLPRSQVIAFGNADNDAEMLSWAGLGIAVKNASPACLAAADLITASYEQDGVALALSKVLAG